MNQELKAKILAYNKKVVEDEEKATDFGIILAEIKKLPPGQLKKVLTDEVLSIFAKYGVVL